MNDPGELIQSVWRFLRRRTLFLVLGVGAGYAFGYHDADAGEPSWLSRGQSLIGVDNVRDDHLRRQRAIDAMRQARMDSLDAQLPR